MAGEWSSLCAPLCGFKEECGSILCVDCTLAEWQVCGTWAPIFHFAFSTRATNRNRMTHTTVCAPILRAQFFAHFCTPFCTRFCTRICARFCTQTGRQTKTQKQPADFLLTSSNCLCLCLWARSGAKSRLEQTKLEPKPTQRGSTTQTRAKILHLAIGRASNLAPNAHFWLPFFPLLLGLLLAPI